MKVIGTVGAIGSGKDEILKYLKLHYHMPYLSTGDMVRQLAAREGLEPTRENLGILSSKYFAEHGKGCFVRMAAEEIASQGWTKAGISGIRAPEDVAVLKEIFKDDFTLVNVSITDMRTRYMRVCMRREERDPNNFNDFQAQDTREEQLFQISRTFEMADYSLNNDGRLEDLHKGIEELITRLRLFSS